jgi:hypothetical protein
MTNPVADQQREHIVWHILRDNAPIMLGIDTLAKTGRMRRIDAEAALNTLIKTGEVEQAETEVGIFYRTK